MDARTGYSGIKVFSATIAQRRHVLGETMTEWMAAHPDKQPVAVDVIQSSDRSHHCITLVMYYRDGAPAAMG